MTQFYKLLILVFVLGCVSAAVAQTQTAVAKIAIVRSDMFKDERNGITRLVNALKAIDDEFTPRWAEVQKLKVQYQDAITILSDSNPDFIAEKMKRAREIEDLIKLLEGIDQRAYAKRIKQLEPIYQDVWDALRSYGKTHGIEVLIDASKIPKAIIALDSSFDITDAFIKDYNTKNPDNPVKE